MMCSWMEGASFSEVISSHGSLLCELRSLFPSHVLYNVLHPTSLFQGCTSVPSPSLYLSLSLFAGHLRRLPINRDYDLEDTIDVTWYKFV